MVRGWVLRLALLFLPEGQQSLLLEKLEIQNGALESLVLVVVAAARP
jgi:hypothetical protein